jgi:WD40 repeat protein
VDIIFGDQSGRIRIWNLNTNSVKDLFDDTEDIGIRSLAISAKATKLVAGNSAGVCYIWTSEDGEEFVP